VNAGSSPSSKQVPSHEHESPSVTCEIASQTGTLSHNSASRPLLLPISGGIKPLSPLGMAAGSSLTARDGTKIRSAAVQCEAIAAALRRDIPAAIRDLTLAPSDKCRISFRVEQLRGPSFQTA
jgi:hypothetical protein